MLELLELKLFFKSPFITESDLSSSITVSKSSLLFLELFFFLN